MHNLNLLIIIKNAKCQGDYGEIKSNQKFQEI